MKIGYICSDSDVPVLGAEGCSIHVREMVSALQGAGHDVFVIPASVGSSAGAVLDAPLRTLDDDGLAAKTWSALVEDPVIAENLLQRDLGMIAYNTRLAAEGTSIIEEERPNVLYERYSLFGWAGVELARKHGIPLILEVNAPLCMEQAGYDLFPLAALAERIEGDVLRSASLVVTVSDWLADWASRLGVASDRILTIPNAVDDRLFRQLPDRTEAALALGLNGHRVIGYVGSFQPWHDIDGLLAAFQSLLTLDSSLRLLLVGDGERRSEVEAKIKRFELGDHTCLTGHVSHETIPMYLAAMDVSVVPYSSAADKYFSPMKLFEAMAAGVPTVAARVGQINSVISDGENGSLYEPGDNAAMADSVWDLLCDTERAAAIGQAARDEVLGSRTWAATVGRILECLEKVT
jgi:glycosyltransferase involved in cell wall biosynthesis